MKALAKINAIELLIVWDCNSVHAFIKQNSQRKKKKEKAMATLKVPHPVPSPAQDAEDLRKAFQGRGTVEKVLISIIAHRDAAQRKQIATTYEELYKENLGKRLEKELSGDLERAVYRWMLDPIERQAILLNLAFKKELDYRVIIEVACVNDPEELLAIKRAYQARYKTSLEEDVASHATGDFLKLLFAFVSPYKYDGPEVNTTLAETEANILSDVIKKKLFYEVDIVRIVSTRSKAQLIATLNRYKDINGTAINKGLLSEKPNEYIAALHTAIWCITDPHKYYEKLLHNCINKKGTDEDVLSRVIVSRAEKDLRIIKEMYHKRTTVSLEQAVQKETSGHYQQFLLALIEG